MDELGVSPCSLVPLPDGSPSWPTGVVGSMSHTDDVCAAAATTASSVLAVGIDVEQDTPLDVELERMVCTEPEQAWIRRQDPRLRGRLGKLFFSAKEAFYKCQYNLTKTLLDFTDVELAIDMHLQVFQIVRINAPLTVIVRSRNIRGRFGYTTCHLATVAVMEKSPHLAGDHR